MPVVDNRYMNPFPPSWMNDFFENLITVIAHDNNYNVNLKVSNDTMAMIGAAGEHINGIDEYGERINFSAHETAAGIVFGVFSVILSYYSKLSYPEFQSLLQVAMPKHNNLSSKVLAQRQ